MTSHKQIYRLIQFIQENIRSSDTTNIIYIDIWNLRLRLQSKQNNIVFGRRGTGKTILLKTLKERKKSGLWFLKIDLEQHKTKSYPNIILSILEALFLMIKEEGKHKIPKYNVPKKLRERTLKKELKKRYKWIREAIDEIDEYEMNERLIKNLELDSATSFPIKIGHLKVTGKKSSGEEVERNLIINKLQRINNESLFIKRLLADAIKLYGLEGIYLCLDDFYYLKEEDQPRILDFFHLLSKDIPLYLKVATIKNVTSILKKIDGVIYGVEIGDDVQEINLDISLEDFSEIEGFMRRIYNGLLKSQNLDKEAFKWVKNDAWIQLCVASGGVPRDFLQILKKALKHLVQENSKIVTLEVIIYCARKHVNSKLKHLRDEFIGNEFALEAPLTYITDLILNTRKTNVFLLSTVELESYPKLKKAINELSDYKMIHLICSDVDFGKRKDKYDKHICYLMDIGLYKKDFLPKEFIQVLPKKRMPNEDKFVFDNFELRTAPILKLKKLNKYLNEIIEVQD